MITITSKRDGFRRCGIAHPARPTEYPDKAFTAKQLKVLQEEPMLTVVIVADEQPKGGGAGKKDKDEKGQAGGQQ